MSGGPQTTNQVASAVNSALNSAIAGVGETLAVDAILAATPMITGIPVIGLVWSAIVNFIVGRFGAYFYAICANAMTSLIIDIQVNQEDSAATKAFSNLQNADKSGDPAQIAKASKDLDSAYANLVNYDGSASA